MLNEDINNAGHQAGREDSLDTHAVRQRLPSLRLISLPNESMQLTVDELEHNAIYCKSCSGNGEQKVPEREPCSCCRPKWLLS